MSELLKNYLNQSNNQFIANQRPNYSNNNTKSIGKIFTESEAFKSFREHGRNQSDKVEISTKALLSGGMGPVRYLNNIVSPVNQPLRVIDLLNTQPVAVGSVEYLEETAFTNNAAPQVEGNLKAESTMTFAERTNKVQTIAHWLGASKQILDDIPAMQNHIETRLVNGLNKVFETQLLFGSNVSPNLQGIMTATVQDLGTMPGTGVTKMDFIRKAITKVVLMGYSVNGIVLNPNDFESIELAKDTTGAYIFMSVGSGMEQRFFRVNVVESISMPVNSFLVGDFANGSTVWMRENAHVQISQTNDDFIRNKYTLLAELRACQTVQSPSAFCKGAFA